MTNAVDVLCVGGPADGRMHCLNRNAQGFPTNIEVVSLDPAGQLTYVPRMWWSEDVGAWYWIATWSGDEPGDSEIMFAIAINQFNSAWDLRDRPAPEPPEEVA